MPGLELLHPNGHSISKAKYEDVMHLLKYVPPVEHENCYLDVEYFKYVILGMKNGFLKDFKNLEIARQIPT